MTLLALLRPLTLTALVAAMAVTAAPADAQERRERRGPMISSQSGEGERGPRASDPRRGDGERRAAWRARRDGAVPPVDARTERREPGPAGRWAAPRDRSYGATTRAERREDARETRRDFRQGYRAGQAADGRSERDAYRDGLRQGRREDWRDERRDERRAYERGYRAGDRADDGRWGNNGDWRWDNRAWRSDRRYDWYRHRAANRYLYSPGRYYAPLRDWRYSRLGIGFRLGSPFYANRFWITDPWRYRLPSAWGPYRWVRYYDDALLVDIYSGRVVDVVHDFFW